MFDILNTNGVSDYWYENDLDLIKAFYWCMSEYVPIDIGKKYAEYDTSIHSKVRIFTCVP